MYGKKTEYMGESKSNLSFLGRWWKVTKLMNISTMKAKPRQINNKHTQLYIRKKTSTRKNNSFNTNC